ncbi:MAG: sulfatase [Myxococcales bacterium]|nr:sulfatase [Myxococcales bacterium]
MAPKSFENVDGSLESPYPRDMQRVSKFAGLAVLVLLAGCGKEGSDGSSPKTTGASPAKAKERAKERAKEEATEPKIPDTRDGFQLFRNLLEEQSRAELRVGGPFIDFGTADQSKYIRGGWKSGWSESKADETSAATLAKGTGLLNTFLTGEPKELVIRARSASGDQVLSFAAGKTKLGELTLGAEWQVQRLPLPDLGKGRKKFKLSHKASAGVEVDWMWLAGTVGQEVPLVVDHAGPVKIGGRLRRSLLAPGPQSYSYYLQIPKESTLIFDYASKTPQEYVVRAQGIKGEAKELFRGTSTGQWQSAKIDLSELAGKATRIEFATEGTGTGGAWGEPGIFVAPVKDTQDSIVSAKKAKNLVLVVMDTTRADQFEAFSAGNGIHTPKLDAFAKEATTFTKAYNNANWTKPSMLTMFSGLYPATHTATKPESMVPGDIELISEHLQKQGVKTQGFTSNPVVSAKFGFERGWDGFGVFYESEAHGEAMYKRAGKWVEDNGEKPFFLYIQTIDPHTTYAVPRKYSSRYYKKNYAGPIGESFTREDQKKINDKVLKPSADDVAWIQALYHGEITYQDEHVGGFLDKLGELGRLEDTIVIVTNDHGEEIYDHGEFGHGWQLFEEMIQAPLMIHYPPMFPKATIIDDITEHVDLAPTVLEAMGLPPMKGTEGTSFLPTLHGSLEQEPRYAVALSDNGKRSIHIGDWKLEVSKSKGWKYLFYMESENPEKRDRKQDAELAGRLCEIYMAEGMAQPSKLQRLRGVGAGKRYQAQDANMDEETRKQMEALGYL